MTVNDSYIVLETMSQNRIFQRELDLWTFQNIFSPIIIFYCLSEYVWDRYTLGNCVEDSSNPCHLAHARKVQRVGDT